MSDPCSKVTSGELLCHFINLSQLVLALAEALPSMRGWSVMVCVCSLTCSAAIAGIQA